MRCMPTQAPTVAMDRIMARPLTPSNTAAPVEAAVKHSVKITTLVKKRHGPACSASEIVAANGAAIASTLPKMINPLIMPLPIASPNESCTESGVESSQ